MLKEICLLLFTLSAILCSGTNLANNPVSLHNILNPCDSLTKISFEDEQDVESLYGEDDFDDYKGDTISSKSSSMLENTVPQIFESVDNDICIDQASISPTETDLESNGSIIEDDGYKIRRKRKRKIVLNNRTKRSKNAGQRRSKVGAQIDGNSQGNGMHEIPEETMPIAPVQDGESNQEDLKVNSKYKGRIRLSPDERKKIKHLVRKGKTTNDIVDLIKHDSSWGRSVSSRTVNRIFNEIKKRSKATIEQIDRSRQGNGMHEVTSIAPVQDSESNQEDLKVNSKGRIRLSPDERKIIEDLVRQGKTISDIVDLLVQYQYDGSWGRNVCRSTVNRIYNEIENQKYFSSQSVGNEVDEVDEFDELGEFDERDESVNNDESVEPIPPAPADTDNKPGLSTAYKGNLVRISRLSKDERKKIEDMVREGKTVREMVNLLREEHRKGMWKRRVSETTIFRIHKEVKSRGN